MFSTSEKWSYGKHVILGAKTGKPPFYFQDVGKVCGRRFSWQFYCRTRKQSHITKNTTRFKTFANLFRNQEWTLKSWTDSSIGVKRIHLRVYHFGQNQRWERLWAFFPPKSIGISENKKSPSVQTEKVKEERKRKQAKRFDGFNQWWIEFQRFLYLLLNHSNLWLCSVGLSFKGAIFQSTCTQLISHQSSH